MAVKKQKMISTSVALPEDMYEFVTQLAYQKDWTRSIWIREAIKEKLERENYDYKKSKIDPIE